MKNEAAHGSTRVSAAATLPGSTRRGGARPLLSPGEPAEGNRGAQAALAVFAEGVGRSQVLKLIPVPRAAQEGARRARHETAGGACHVPQNPPRKWGGQAGRVQLLRACTHPRARMRACRHSLELPVVCQPSRQGRCAGEPEDGIHHVESQRRLQHAPGLRAAWRRQQRGGPWAGSTPAIAGRQVLASAAPCT